MKWALIIYFFTAGPDGGWHEGERTFYQTKEICVEYRDFFNNMPKPGTLMAKCKMADGYARYNNINSN
jgi:hypothetical protein